MIQPKLAIVPYDYLPEWDSFVEAHPKGTIFHTSAMIRTMKSAKRHSPFAYAAVDKSGEICAILVAVKVSTLGRMFSPISTRSVFYAEPICLENRTGYLGLEQLLEHHDKEMRRHTLFAEIRPVFQSIAEHDVLKNEGYEWQGYFNYELDLRTTEEQLFAGLNRQCRNNVRSAMRRGVTVREVDPLRETDRFYAMVSKSYSGSRVPLVDRSLFDTAFREMPAPTSRLFLAEYQGEVAAAACFLAYKGRVYYWYAGTERIKGISAMSMLVWEAIVRYSTEGYEVFDFAGAGWEGEAYGPGRFKSKFGGVLTNFGRYRKVYSAWKLRLASPAYKITRNWIAPSTRSH